MSRVWLLLFSLGVVWGHAYATPSAGCGEPAAAAFSGLELGGQARSVILNVPEPYDPERTYPLVFAFHGRTSPAAEVRGYYDLEPHAPQTLGPTVFVYPVALTQADGTFGWWEPGDAPDALRDFALFDELLSRLGETYCINTERVYAVGHSLGGSFVNALGCHRAEVLRAVASLGAGPGGGTCEGSVAAMVLHNPRDELVPFALGQRARDQYIEQNGVRGRSRPSEPRSLNCRRYAQGASLEPVLWCPHTQDTNFGRYYPHGWPEETGEAVLRFFALLP